MKPDKSSFKTFVYPLDAVGIPMMIAGMWVFVCVATLLGIGFVWEIMLIFGGMCFVLFILWRYWERNVCEVVTIDREGIHTKRICFRWNENCIKWVCTAHMGRMEYPKCLYYSRIPILNESQIMLKRDVKNTVVYPLNKKSGIMLKKFAPDIYEQFRYDIEK